MAAPTTTVARNDGAIVKGLSNATGTVVTIDHEPEMANGASIPQRAAATESPLPPTYVLGQAKNSAAGALWNSDANLTLPSERPAPGQE